MVDSTPHTSPSQPLPPDPEGLNNRRAAWAEEALATFIKATGPDSKADALGDLLCDFMHWCDRQNLSFDDLVARAKLQYRIETTAV